MCVFSPPIVYYPFYMFKEIFLYFFLFSRPVVAHNWFVIMAIPFGVESPPTVRVRNARAPFAKIAPPLPETTINEERVTRTNRYERGRTRQVGSVGRRFSSSNTSSSPYNSGSRHLFTSRAVLRTLQENMRSPLRGTLVLHLIKKF